MSTNKLDELLVMASRLGAEDRKKHPHPKRGPRVLKAIGADVGYANMILTQYRAAFEGRI